MTATLCQKVFGSAFSGDLGALAPLGAAVPLSDLPRADQLPTNCHKKTVDDTRLLSRLLVTRERLRRTYGLSPAKRTP